MDETQKTDQIAPFPFNATAPDDAPVPHPNRLTSVTPEWRFSDEFGVRRSQAELDFVDIPMRTDIALFLDPFALSVVKEPWFEECTALVVSYFQQLLDAIKKRDRATVSQILVGRLPEPNETRFGYSMGRPQGRGMGHDQTRDLMEALANSEAVRTGNLRDLADCELVIPGIGADKISDMTINILRGKLIEYTQQQCKLWDVPVRCVNAGLVWDPNSGWVSRYEHLPVFEGGRLLLIPKVAARYHVAEDHHKYYHGPVLEYLQAEHLQTGTALVRVLQNGERRPPYKKDLQDLHPLSKEFLYQFTVEHPEVLLSYKAHLARGVSPIDDILIESRQREQREMDYERMGRELEDLAPGHANATRYHRLITGILEAVFYPWIYNPVEEQKINEGRKRIDLVFDRSATEGFFAELETRHRIRSAYIMVECKNYSRDMENPEFDQLAGRFNPCRGQFGMLVCRSLDEEVALKRQKDFVLKNEFILVLQDKDIQKLLQFAAQGQKGEINAYMNDLLRKLHM